jgi:sugar (pentulose or hexulose) kinase
MFLGIDLGTTNIKAVAVDGHGHVAARGSASVGRRDLPDGGVEQDIDEIYHAACQAMRQVAGGLAGAAVESVGVSSQGGALQLLDSGGGPLGPVVSWLDARGRPFDRQLVAELGPEFFAQHVGCRTSMVSPGQILRLRQTAPEMIRPTAGIGFVGDVIVARLCGRRAHDATSLSIALLLNPRRGCADPELIRRLGIEAKQLPELLPADLPAGTLLPAAAEATGLPPGIPVSPALHDQYAASLGVGAVHEGDVSLGTGTAWAMVANSRHLVAPATHHAIVCPHPVRGLFGQLLSMVNGGSALQWAARLTGTPLAPAEIDAAIEPVGPGADGLVFWPHLAGCPGPGADASTGGRVAGVRFGHGPGHLLRAVVEGLSCELARHLQMLAHDTPPVGRLLLSGGASASRLTPQIIADVTGRPVASVAEPAVSAWGAAIVGRALVEPGVGLARLAERFAPARREFLPGGNAEAYRELLERYLEGLGIRD